MIEYNSRQWIRVLMRVHGSVLPSLLSRIALTAGLGGGALYLYRTRGIHMPTTAHTLVGIALGLLLVFRTNASYDRYWEGRKLLGAITNRSRDLIRQAASFIDGDGAEARAERAEIQRLISVLYALIRLNLRQSRALDDAALEITPEEKLALEAVASRPAIAAFWLSQVLVKAARGGRLTEQRLQSMDANITSLVDSWGGAERIIRTPVPFAYAHHIKGFLTLFCFSVPFALVDSMKNLTPIVAAIVTYGMFGIEEIGVEIEDPFGEDPNDLPVDRIGQNIAIATADVLRNRDGDAAREKRSAA